MGKGCEMFDCPKCVTVCKQPHCVTHCQAPKPECEPVCEEPKLTGNAINPLALNPSANLFVKIPIASLKSNAVPVLLVHQKLHNHSPSLKKLKNKTNVVNAKSKLILTNQMIIFIHSYDGIVSF